MSPMRSWRWLLLVVGVGLATPASASMIRFTNGTRLRGTIVRRAPGEVVVQFDFGTASFRPEEIAAVEDEAPSDAAEPPVLPAAPAATSSSAAPSTLPAAMKAVASIGALFDNGRIGIGSGAVINATGVIVTNYHLIAGARRIAVILPADAAMGRAPRSTPHTARVLHADPCHDLALIRIPMATPDSLHFAEEASVQPGQEVLAIGNPEGLAVSVSKGVIRAVRQVKELVDPAALHPPACNHLSAQALGEATFIQTTAAINPGNSGGPLLNARQEIVGINTVGFFPGGSKAGSNVSVHVKHVRDFVGSYATE